MSWMIAIDSDFCIYKIPKGCSITYRKCAKENCPKRIKELEEGKWISQE